ncbi:MAG: aspartyl protease family protein [Gammaproteobacteria bacterium]
MLREGVLVCRVRWRFTGRLAVVLMSMAVGLALAEETAVAPVPAAFPAAITADDDPDAPIEEVVIQAPEPRYVAPTRRDRIGRIWAPVYINNQGPFRLVLDTGSSHAAVNASVAVALGIPLTDKHQVLLRGVTGSRVVPTITVDSLIVGDLQFRPARLPIVVDALGGADGVLGTDGMEDKRIFIDFIHDRITIFRSRKERAPMGFRTIPVKIVQGLLVTPIKVGSVRATAIIDTGGQASLANEAFRVAIARRIATKDVLSDLITGATLDTERGSRMVTPPIQIGDVVIRQASVTTGDLHIFKHWDMVKDPVMLIGMDVLGLFDTLIIDYKRRELQVRMRHEYTDDSRFRSRLTP